MDLWAIPGGWWAGCELFLALQGGFGDCKLIGWTDTEYSPVAQNRVTDVFFGVRSLRTSAKLNFERLSILLAHPPDELAVTNLAKSRKFERECESRTETRNL